MQYAPTVKALNVKTTTNVNHDHEPSAFQSQLLYMRSDRPILSHSLEIYDVAAARLKRNGKGYTGNVGKINTNSVHKGSDMQ